MTAAPAAGDAAAVVLRGVTRRYQRGAEPAVDAVSLAVAPGEVVTLIGPSGCGKSTVLRLVAGLERPDAGCVEVGGDLVADARHWREPEERRVGLVFQDHALFPHLDVAHNIGFGLRHLTRAERAERVAAVVDRLGLGGLVSRHPHQLSGGEQQRVALARALAPRPAVVLLDEPFSSLDENLRVRVREETMAAVRDSGSAAVLVTHDQDEGLSLGDRVAVMCDGVLEQVGTPPEVYETPVSRFVATFMGEADFLPAHVDRALLTSEIGVVSTVPGWGGTSVAVEAMLRPHEVALQVDAGSACEVVDTAYHGAFVLHTVRLGSGRRLRSWQQHGVVHPVGTRVAVSVVPGARPVLLAGDRALREPPAGTPTGAPAGTAG